MGPIDLFKNEVYVNLSCAICYSFFLADLIPLAEKQIVTGQSGAILMKVFV